MLNRRESSKIKFHPPRLIRKHSRYKFNLLLERDEVVIGGFGFSVERYEKLTANRDDWRRIARAPVNRVTSTKDGKVGGGWEDEEEKKRRGGSGFKVVVVVAGWWEWHGGKESRAVAAKSAHSAALLDRLWNINLQHYRPEERTLPPLRYSSGCMQLPRHPKPAQITWNHLEWILNFSTPPRLPIHRRIARQLDYQFIHRDGKIIAATRFIQLCRWKEPDLRGFGFNGF